MATTPFKSATVKFKNGVSTSKLNPGPWTSFVPEYVAAVNPEPPEPAIPGWNSPLEPTKQGSYEAATLYVYTLGVGGEWQCYQCSIYKDIEEAKAQAKLTEDGFNHYHTGSSKDVHQKIHLIITGLYVEIKDKTILPDVMTVWKKTLDYTQVKKDKVFLNGPNKNNEFLKKKGKHYA